jgi:hypothetical protein
MEWLPGGDGMPACNLPPRRLSEPCYAARHRLLLLTSCGASPLALLLNCCLLPLYYLLLQYYTELGMPAQARMLTEQAEQQGVSSAAAGMLGSLRGAVGGTVGSLVSRMQQQGSLR